MWDEIKQLAEKLRSKGTTAYRNASSNLRGNVKAIANPATRKDWIRGVSPSTYQIAKTNFKPTVQKFKQDPGKLWIGRAYSTVVPDVQATLSPIRTLKGQEPSQFAKDASYFMRGATKINPFNVTNYGLDKKGTESYRSTEPTTERQRKMQKLGLNAFGTLATAPIGGSNYLANVAMRNIRGAIQAPIMNTVSTLATQGRLPTGKELLSSAGQGMENSWKLALSDLVLDKAISSTGNKSLQKFIQNNVYKPFKNQEFKNGIKTVMIRSLMEVIPENTIFNTFDQLSGDDKGKFLEEWIKDLPSEFAGNMIYGLVASGFNVATNLKPETKMQIQQSFEKTKTKFADNFKGDYILTFQDKSIPMDKEQASAWTARLQSLGIEYKLEDLGTRGGFASLGKMPKMEDVKPAKTDLLSEAKKYKSAEEFVDFNTPRVYRGQSTGEKGIPREGMSTTLDFNQADKYAKARGLGGEKKTYYLNPNAKKISLEDVPNEVRSSGEGSDFAGRAAIWARKQGYDILDMSKGNEAEMRILNKNAFITKSESKSQLTDIYNQAKGTTLQVKNETNLSNLRKRPVSFMPSLDSKVKNNTVVTEIESFGRRDSVPLLDEYKGRQIVMAGKDVSVWDPKDKTLFRVGLDDSKESGYRFVDEKYNTIENAKKYIDWEDKQRTIKKPVKSIAPEDQKVPSQLKQEADIQYKPPKELKVDKANIPSTKVSSADNEVLRTSMGNIIPPKVRGDISAPETDFKNWKDKRVPVLSRETLERNIEDVAGKDAPKIKKFIVDPVRANETQSVEFQNTKKNLIKEKIVKNLGIKKNSLEDKLIQRYGEKRITLNELKQATDKWQKVVKAEQILRNQYDEILKQVNAQRKKFNYDPIPKREDYFRHYQEITNAIKSFGLILRSQDLPTEISGLTSIFTPGKPFSTAELQRKGGAFTESAIGGFENYIDSISRQIYHIDSVQRGRALEKYIREAGKNQEADLPNFVANVREWTNLVSGKKATLDRAFESVLGREVYGVANFLRSRTSANMVGGNVSSALTNFIPFTQSLSTTNKPSAVKGMLDGVASPLKSDFTEIDGVKSNFLTRRFPEGKISPNLIQKTGEAANWLFEAIDKFTSVSIVSSKFYENLTKGLDPKEAMKQADEYAGKVLADRSIGNLPNLMNTKTLGIVTQFQTEVNNQWSFLTKDIPRMSEGNKVKVISSLAQFAILAYVFNNVFEKVVGRRPQIDPIQYTLQIAGMTDDTEDQPIGKRLISAGTDLAGNIPFTGGITGGRLPISAAIPDVPGLIKGEANTKEELLKPVAYLLPPFGGSQARKSIQGAKLVDKGYSATKTGRARFLAPDTTGGKIKAVLFGQWSTPESREYVNSGFKTLSDKQTAKLNTYSDPKTAKLYFNSVMKAKDEDNSTKMSNEISKLTYDEFKKQYPEHATYYAAEKIFSTVDNLPKKDKEGKIKVVKEFANRGYSTAQINKAIEKIRELDEEGMTKTDRELLLYSPEVKAIKIIDRFEGIQSEKKKKELLELYKKYGILTKDVEDIIIKLNKGK